jgi:hypothetical protein
MGVKLGSLTLRKEHRMRMSEENIWTKEVSSDGRVEKTALFVFSARYNKNYEVKEDKVGGGM